LLAQIYALGVLYGTYFTADSGRKKIIRKLRNTGKPHVLSVRDRIVNVAQQKKLSESHLTVNKSETCALCVLNLNKQNIHILNPLYNVI